MLFPSPPQVRYLGLVENVRVRRAGYAYRQRYDLFLRRYKFICPSIWPNPRNGDKEGTRELISYYQMEVNKGTVGREFPRGNTMTSFCSISNMCVMF